MQEQFKVKLIASFLGLKYVPLPIVFGSNNANPKLIFKDNEVEHRAIFITRKISYEDISSIDVFLAPMTTNICLVKNNSIFTFIGNTNSEPELYNCLLYLKNKNCEFTSRAKVFFDRYELILKALNELPVNKTSN